MYCFVFFACVHQSLWVYPIYLLSFTLNSVWYQDIAERVHTLHPTKGSSSALGSKPYASTSRKLNLAYTLADELYRYLFCFIYLVYATWIYWVPYVGPGGSFVLTCGLYAYSSFDYSWRNTRRPLHACIDVVHRHWAYFLGFGTPLTLATFFFPTVPGSALFAVLFPWYIVLAHLAHPPSTSTYPSIPMVQPILYLCDIVVRAVPYFWKKLRRT
ncbi:Etoposide induced 2.4 mRNA [Coelomomyces lativittatus]|nr:Etoposide induced 2.4 mRNA [Coelomomyces lativittatus]KAJ1501221.1 Etoposide induced 2.4 mRNA [Coelomomyces lativittatus]